MYLKSIEVQGFKSFANKILFEFHNGITGIVGPNGSGKSNVADAVRWVLGEQRAKQLRGASMQDVIFSGTENRKPLSYAYVAITLDNGDHQLNLDYEEVTVARRVYRSGESEYLLNGTPCRLKDVNELFYDTGIGKEGYSIIGQGQIERILSGKPEERRELFDEAAGIVKYKRRKAAAQKKLENERQNLVRVNDILAELEKQLGPLERQSQKARIYLKKKEEQKTLDVNLFLLEVQQMRQNQQELEEKIALATGEYEQSQRAFDAIKAEYELTEQELGRLEESMEKAREQLADSSLKRGQLEGEVNVLKEQIRGAKQSEEHFSGRRETVQKQQEERLKGLSEYQAQAKELAERLDEVAKRRDEVTNRFNQIQTAVAQCQQSMEQGKNEVIELLNDKASTKAQLQRYDTMLEQANIRRGELNKRLVERKSEEEALAAAVFTAEEHLREICEHIDRLEESGRELDVQEQDWRRKQSEAERSLEEATRNFHREQSRLESMKNIAERYDGYGNSIRRVMECQTRTPGILGVVADLIEVKKEYETAIETALGGSIQNIVTRDEDTAKAMIAYLKQNRFGRATFLPLTSVGRKPPQINRQPLNESGVIGLANTLVHTKPEYEGLCTYLLGRTYVVDHIDHAVALARKYQYSLRIVTLEGESLSPGGSMTGGAFKNSSNLLGRRREIDALGRQVQEWESAIKKQQHEISEIQTARARLKEEQTKTGEQLQSLRIEQNTAELNVQHAREQKRENDQSFAGLNEERQALEQQVEEIRAGRQEVEEKIEQAQQREKEIEWENNHYQEVLEKQTALMEQMQTEISGVQLEEANLAQQTGFANENLRRLEREASELLEELKQIDQEAAQSRAGIAHKQQELKQLEEMIDHSGREGTLLQEQVKELQGQKETLSLRHKGFFQKREELSGRIGNLDKELFRLKSQKEKLSEGVESHNRYMWEEYELTYHNALKLRNEEYEDLSQLKKWIAAIREELRSLGDVNVNAIEDYQSVSERYQFMKEQHDDLVTAEETLLQIIEDLDTGMRKQFLEKFAQIRQEFDRAFKELFGGGKGTLELVEDEDILECGIRIIAQPPGKKLQNMMQLSGGEKALTAISLLFAIQNLKPSPFCLLDEIEAALDDSNVGRFAQYLHRLTKNTQFIVITHRRGTMAAADRLYGITMQEKGVSTLVSVNLIEEALEE